MIEKSIQYLMQSSHLTGSRAKPFEKGMEIWVYGKGAERPTCPFSTNNNRSVIGSEPSTTKPDLGDNGIQRDGTGQGTAEEKLCNE